MSEDVTQASGFARIAPLYLVIFIDAMGFAMIAPILAAHPLFTSATAQAIFYGAAVGIYPLATFFAAPALGNLSDRYGRLPVLVLCGCGLAVSYAFIAFGLLTASATLVILGRLLGGGTAATQAVALAALADAGPLLTKDNRVSFGLLASSLGFVIGPAVSGLTADAKLHSTWGDCLPILAIVAATVVTVLWLLGSYRDPPRSGMAAQGSLKDLLRTLNGRAIRGLSLIFLLQQFGWGAFFFFVPVFLFDRFKLPPGSVSFFMALMGIGFCLNFAFIMPALKRQFSARAIAVVSMLGTTFAIIICAVAPSAAVAWALALPVAAGAALGYGALIMLFLDQATENEGEVLGLTASINALAFGVISLSGGVLSVAAIVAPLVAAAAFMLLSTALLMRNAFLTD
jgi:DHA1 family tetracycline resistance protein-like MFS transporter